MFKLTSQERLVVLFLIGVFLFGNGLQLVQKKYPFISKLLQGQLEMDNLNDASRRVTKKKGG